MNYTIIEPPSYGCSFRDMSRKEALEYYKWYIDQIPVRVKILQQVVRSSVNIDYQDWISDKSPESLKVLGFWFAENIRVIPVSKDYEGQFVNEIANVPTQYQPIFKMPNYLLSRETQSLIIDIGMYLGEVFCAAHKQISWTLLTKNRRDAYYHEPVLTGFGKKGICNPTALVDVWAKSAYEKRTTPLRLWELFDIWSYYVEES